MMTENGEWYMTGLEYDDPDCIHSPKDLIEYVKKIGFLPLFGNDIPGFSVEEHTWAMGWWSGNPDDDPWEWRVQIARSREVAYGKFFCKKVGFISLEWLPYFANCRRNGYDFGSLYDEGLANIRSKRIMDIYADPEQEDGWKDEFIFSTEVKKLAGFGKDGAKNFPGVLMELQMQMYLVMVDFRHRKNKRGEEYGMPVSILLPPEAVWGYDAVTAGYIEAPEESANRITAQIKRLYPSAEDSAVQRMVGMR